MADPADTLDGPPGRFLFDLGDPDCYLVAERILGELPVVAEWVPVLTADLTGPPPSPSSPPPTRPDPSAPGPSAPDPSRLAARVAAQGLLPLRLPPTWPPDSRLAMRTAAFARTGGKTVAFALAAFRQAFAAGRDLGQTETVLLAAAAAELHPRAVLAGVELRSVGTALREAAEQARAAGVIHLPAIVHDGRVFQGPSALDDALDALAAPGRAR